MFGFKKRPSVQDSIYGESTNVLTVENADMGEFRLPNFSETEIMARVDERTEHLKAKISGGELDSANVDLIVTTYTNLFQELDAELSAWECQCVIRLHQLVASVKKQYEGRERAAKVGQEIISGFMEGDC